MTRHSNTIYFSKMHGLGNDFMIIDSRYQSVENPEWIACTLSDRRRGIGFDQLAIVKTCHDVDAELSFYNADGSFSAACGNATRCIARNIFEDTGKKTVYFKTSRGVLECRDVGQNLTAVNMGNPQFDWQDIPLAKKVDTNALPITGSPVALGMGNPHCIFIVNDINKIDVATRGSELERHPLFPERTNVEFIEIKSRNEIRLRIWERGVGITLASGSGSCAGAVAAAKLNLVDRNVTVHLDGGSLNIDWQKNGVWMVGPTTHVFNGEIILSELRKAHA